MHVPIDHKSGKNKGFAYVKYSTPELATKAQQGLDGKLFQGRLLHIISSAAKRQSGLDDFAIAKLPLKKQQQIKRKATAASSIFNWNSMYMNVRCRAFATLLVVTDFIAGRPMPSCHPSPTA